MSQETLTAFLQKLSHDEALRNKFTQFAAENGFDLGELTDEDLDAVAGGGIMKSRHEAAKNAISSMEREGTIESSS